MVFSSSESCDESEEDNKSILPRIPTAGTDTEALSGKKAGIWMETGVKIETAIMGLNHLDV